MSATDLLSIASEWSYWDRPPDPSVGRSVSLPNELRPGLAVVVQGIRRAGKSTLLGQLIDRYGLERRRCLFVNFEDPRLAGALDHSTLQGLVDAFEGQGSGEATYFLDEIQWVNGWERGLRTRLERPRGRRFVVTGSNARLLSGEFATTLTGRHLTVEVFPFDFEEFRTLRPGATLAEYLRVGGFPAPASSPDGDRLLQAYFHDIIERDMRERVAARSTRPLLQLVQMLFESAGSETSVRRAAASIGMAVDTTSLYINAAESAYLAFGCPYFAWSERKRSSRNRKYYPIDTGLRRVSVTATGDDRGKHLECAVFLLLRRRFGQVSYWRDQTEVDFVIEHQGKERPIQVTWEEPSERHHRALDDFHSQHPQTGEAVFVTAESFERGVPELGVRELDETP